MARFLWCLLLGGSLIAGFALLWQWRHVSRSTANFEIREVHCAEETTEISWTYKCQGTLLTREDDYRNGELIVWFEDASKRAGDKDLGTEFLQSVRVSKGVATLNAFAYYSRKHMIGNASLGDYEADPGPPKPGWNILGFSHLEPVNVTLQK